MLHALLWLIHDGKSGSAIRAIRRSLTRRTACRRPFAVAIKAMERAGLLSWVNRIVKVRVAARDLFGRTAWAWRVPRTSNAYVS